MHILRCMDLKFCEISHKVLNPYTAKYALHGVLIVLTIYDILDYDILSLSHPSGAPFTKMD